jgi:hypothetical protein
MPGLANDTSGRPAGVFTRMVLNGMLRDLSNLRTGNKDGQQCRRWPVFLPAETLRYL